MDTVINSQKLKELREGRTLSDVAEQIGVTRQQIWHYENGKSDPSLPVLVKLAALYKVPVEDLLAKNFSTVG